MNQSILSAKTRLVALRLDPLDVLFFRDGRPFHEASRGESGLPRPQTLAGALRTHLLRRAGCDGDGFRKLGEYLRAGQSLEQAITSVCGAGWIARVEVRGPWLCEEVNGTLEILVSIPANVQEIEGGMETSSVSESTTAEKNVRSGVRGNSDRRWVRFDPLEPELDLPGWKPPVAGMRPLWPRLHARSQRRSGYLRPAGLAKFLAGEDPPPETVVSPEDLYGFDQRTGTAIQPDQLTIEEHLFYAVSLLALRPGVAFYAEVNLPSDAPSEILRGETLLDFGGEGHKVLAREVAPFMWPDPPDASNGRVLLLLTTPVVFSKQWCPRLPAGTRLVAAAVTGYEAFSGWDLARGGPKPTRFAVPAGSVYFLETSDQRVLISSLAESDEDRQLGFGCVVQGVWNYV